MLSSPSTRFLVVLAGLLTLGSITRCWRARQAVLSAPPEAEVRAAAKEAQTRRAAPAPAAANPAPPVDPERE